MQRHRGRSDEASRETMRAADRQRKSLGRQNEADIRRPRRLAIAREQAAERGASESAEQR